ncbi:hypothetical protein SV7mr_07100 [Stieleria bergensis]|uniref:Permease n=1 Tax=Stieleria bergensis TaxID=2528025 RepID=A0A517SQ18_9BACT|nr:hypothetical protein SV7mr_07100 [Planctomycetes bacterium SV_7m_r]
MSDTSSPDQENGSPPGASYKWWGPGDINAFFGLMLDNLTGLLLVVVLLSGFGFPTDFITSSMIPGTAIGVLLGDLAFVYFAFRLAKTSGNPNVTAMPLGLDTPSVFGITLLILGPSYLEGINSLGLDQTAAAYRTWHIGIWCMVVSGIFKLALAPATGWLQRVVPRAALLGSLAAIALALISFLPMSEILKHPLPGLVALAIVLVTLIGKIRLPSNLPGTLGALVVGGGLYYLMCFLQISHYELPEFQNALQSVQWLPTQWTEALQGTWLRDLPAALSYLPIALPFAIATVVGGIDCTESAAAAGDRYHTPTVIGVEAIATLIAGFCGGVIQTTPYIGHPAYKAMGGRSGYTFGTAVVIGSAGLLGYFALLNELIPLPAVMPILVFIGLEITSQSFAVTPKRHYAAVAIACLPALAALVVNLVSQVLSDPALADANIHLSSLTASFQSRYEPISILASGFILTSLFWAWTLAAVIDRKLATAGTISLLCAGLTLFGLIHSPLAGNRMFLPFGPESWGDLVLQSESRRLVMEYVAAYVSVGVLFLLWSRLPTAANPQQATTSDEHDSQPDNT